MRKSIATALAFGLLLAARPTDSHATTGEIALNFGSLQIHATAAGPPDVHIDVHIETGMPACGIGYELAFLLLPLMWLRRLRRRLI